MRVSIFISAQERQKQTFLQVAFVGAVLECQINLFGFFVSDLDWLSLAQGQVPPTLSLSPPPVSPLSMGFDGEKGGRGVAGRETKNVTRHPKRPVMQQLTY